MNIRYALTLPLVAATLALNVASLTAQSTFATAKMYDFVRAQKVVVLSAEESGIIAQIDYHPQEFVSQGEVLLQLDPKLAQLEIAKIKAQIDLSTKQQDAQIRLDYAQDNLKIAQELYDQIVGATRVGSPKELKEAQQTRDLAQLRQTDAQLEMKLLELSLRQWRKRLQQHSVRAPWDGVIVPFSSIKNVPEIETAKHPEVGEIIRAGQAVIAMMKVDFLHVPWSIRVDKLDTVSLGQQANVYVPETSDQPIPAQVVYVSPTVDSTGLVSIEVEFTNLPLAQTEKSPPRGFYRYRFRPGMNARVELLPNDQP